MPIGNESADVHGTKAGRREAVKPMELGEYPVREYIAAMTREMSQMARWTGDEKLACALDIAADIAEAGAKEAKDRKDA